MSLPDPTELKRKLRTAGFEIYRSTSELIQLAERVRDNLIMDSGVSAHWDRGHGRMFVRVTVRAQASHFPGADEKRIWDHAIDLASEFLAAGYDQENSRSTPVPDPSDPTKSLDTSHEIQLRKPVVDVDDLFRELRVALSHPRATSDD